MIYMIYKICIVLYTLYELLQSSQGPLGEASARPWCLPCGGGGRERHGATKCSGGPRRSENPCLESCRASYSEAKAVFFQWNSRFSIDFH